MIARPTHHILWGSAAQLRDHEFRARPGVKCLTQPPTGEVRLPAWLPVRPAASPTLSAPRFCAECGASLTAAPAGREVRKTVTVLFCDVVGSTALGERLDPEAVRRVLGR